MILVHGLVPNLNDLETRCCQNLSDLFEMNTNDVILNLSCRDMKVRYPMQKSLHKTKQLIRWKKKQINSSF